MLLHLRLSCLEQVVQARFSRRDWAGATCPFVEVAVVVVTWSC